MAKQSLGNAEKQEHDGLAKELRSLIPKLDAEGLSFLIEQAQVHLYNMQVDSLNQTMEASRQRAAKGSAKNKAAKSADTSSGFNEIKMSESGASCYIVYKTEWIMFSRDEMFTLIRIASAVGSDLEIKERLFNWFARERTDLLRSAGIADKFDNKLKSLAALLKKFKLKPPAARS